jgi:hypothetical protein
MSLQDYDEYNRGYVCMFICSRIKKDESRGYKMSQLNTMEDKSKNIKEDKSKKGKNSSSVSPAIFFLPPLHV